MIEESIYHCEYSVWEVIFDVNEIKFDSLKVYIVAKMAAAAAIKAKALVDKEWNDNNVEALSVKWLNPINGIIE